MQYQWLSSNAVQSSRHNGQVDSRCRTARCCGLAGLECCSNDNCVHHFEELVAAHSKLISPDESPTVRHVTLQRYSRLLLPTCCQHCQLQLLVQVTTAASCWKLKTTAPVLLCASASPPTARTSCSNHHTCQRHTGDGHLLWCIHVPASIHVQVHAKQHHMCTARLQVTLASGPTRLRLGEPAAVDRKHVRHASDGQLVQPAARTQATSRVTGKHGICPCKEPAG
jgi:hypothetical protein